MSALAVGLNLLYLTDTSGGSGRYARELIPSILTVEPGTRIVGFVSSQAPVGLFRSSWAGEVEWVTLPVRPAGRSPLSPLLYLGAQWATLPILARRRKLDVVHGLANLAPLASPGVATAVTLLDVTWIHYPKTMSRRATVGMKLLAPASAKAADRVIAISEAGKNDIVKTIGLDEAKIDVTPLGVRMNDRVKPLSQAEVRRRVGLSDGPLVLTVAQKREHKNLARLVRAVAAIPGAQLALPGEPTPHERELKTLAAELRAAERVHFPAWVSEEDLEGLYAAARCFVLPSLMEGFGLPVLEAMRRGVPVACSNVSSLPEVAGDAALFFDPQEVKQIKRSIERLITDDELVADLIARGYERCRVFTWEETARLTLASYRRAIEARSARTVIPRRLRAHSSPTSRRPSPPS